VFSDPLVRVLYLLIIASPPLDHSEPVESHLSIPYNINIPFYTRDPSKHP